MKFELGAVVMTRPAAAFFQGHEGTAFMLLARHHCGDWGDLGPEDKALNDAAVESGEDRIFSAYLVNGEKVYIITEHDRSSTCIMLADDY